MAASEANKGLLIVLCGPSGVGKSTISRQLAERLHVWYTVSATTRPKQDGDDKGKTYDHISKPAATEGLQFAADLRNHC